MLKSMKYLINITVGLVLGVLVCYNSYAEIFISKIPVVGTETATPFDQRFVNLMRRWRIPGASVVIMRHGRTIIERGYGWADLKTHQPVQPTSLFRIGSVSKAVTAVSVLKLVDNGRIKLNDRIFQILQDLRPLNLRHNPAIYQITIRDLLQMTSGWQTNVIDPMFGPWSTHMLTQLNDSNEGLPPNCETAARLMMGLPLQYRPGTQYSYSNVNYCLLGLLINKVNGLPYTYKNYENFVQQSVLLPLGITDMRIGDTLAENRAPNEVSYYSYADITPDPNDIVSTLARVDGLPYSNSQILRKNFADGGWIASAVDLGKFIQAVANHQILSQRTFNIMLQKPSYQKEKQNYFALGWSVKYADNGTYWLKTGTFTGTYALIMQRNDGTSYVALFNTKPPQRNIFLSQLRRVLTSA